MFTGPTVDFGGERRLAPPPVQRQGPGSLNGTSGALTVTAPCHDALLSYCQPYCQPFLLLPAVF